jgi:Rha family phage regulatory protein
MLLIRGKEMDLVEVKKNGVFCDSQMVSKKFGIKHAYVCDNIRKLIADLSGLRVGSVHPKIQEEERIYRGNTYIAYLMNRHFFSLLSMRFKGKKAFEWQVKFNDAFYEMERHILQSNLNKSDNGFLKIREQGKIARKEETGVIKEFVDYATRQGSMSAKFYYKHITNATYKALGLMVQRKPKLRDSLNVYEVSELLLAERLAQNALKKYMDLGRNYKDIYESVKTDLISFANNMRLSNE